MTHNFVSALAQLQIQNCFNPYSDRCAIHDHQDAPRKRSDALSKIVTSAQSSGVDAIWIGRDLGYRGGRRTGLALTDDVHLAQHAARWQVSFERPTIGLGMPERTAAVVWDLLAGIDAKIFLWNVFPLHPHEEGLPFSNRSHNSR